MNEYEKIKLALFAIEYNAYIIQSCNDELKYIPNLDEFTQKRVEGRQELLAGCVRKLQAVMEDLGETINAMDAATAVDSELMKIPYAIVYGRKTAEDYENE